MLPGHWGGAKVVLFDAAKFTSPGGQPANEDSVYLAQGDGRLVAIVADGLGAHGGGGIASATAVEALHGALRKAAPAAGHIDGRALEACFAAANAAVLEKQKPGLAMKSTAAMLVLEEGYAAFAHIGDSRGYAFRGGKIARQTVDHSVSQMAVFRGDITPAQIRFHKSRNRLLFALGMEGCAPGEVTLLDPPLVGDAYLLCSDGFWEYVYEDEMEMDLARARARDADGWLSLMLARIPPRAQARESPRVQAGNDNLSAITVTCRVKAAQPL